MKKVIFITGSTDGIGKLAAILLAKEGHELYLHGRKPAKLAKVIAEVKNESNNQNIDGFVADFSDLSAVKTMANQIQEKLSKIDVLINNAGIFKSPDTTTMDGFDIRFAVNYLAPYILTEALLPLLKKANTPRIINLSSAAQADVSHAALTGKSEIGTQEAYAQSKLAITMWSFYLAKQEEDITTIAVNPGSLLNTNMVREAYGRFWSSADKGANILFDLAVKENYQKDSGKYFDNDKGTFNQAHPTAYNNANVESLIQTTEDIISKL